MHQICFVQITGETHFYLNVIIAYPEYGIRLQPDIISDKMKRYTRESNILVQNILSSKLKCFLSIIFLQVAQRHCLKLPVCNARRRISTAANV